eukprot:jgi/Undpi1/10472/HiC_scaffold_29.g12922.m1
MADAASNDGEILEPQGNHYGWLSLAPLSEAGEWSSTPGVYFKKLQEKNGGAPIYKAHPGLACITITDHASGKWFFEQPDTVLDRQDGPYFGPLKCTKEYLDDSLPALVTNIPESHADVRAYTINVLKERLSATQPALAHASDNFYKDLRANGLGDYTTVYDIFLKQSYAFMLEWVFGTGEEGGQPLPPFEDFINVNPSDIGVLLKLTVDTPVANAAAAVAQALAGGITSAQKASVDVLLDSIRASKMWPTYVEMLAQNNVPIKSPERSFMFNTGFQSSSAIAKNMEYAVGSLTAFPDFAEELRQEVDGQASFCLELTIASVGDLSKFPLLDSFHWEILRMFPAPPFFFKTAKMDLVVPTSSGARYQIRKGDMLCCHHPLVQIDEIKFGSDAKEFNPKRFVGNPDLKKDVFAYAFPDPANAQPADGMPWGCAAHTVGVLDGILKVFYGRMLQEITWEMTEPAVIDPVLFLGTVGPKNMAFAKVTPRN